MAEKKLSIVVLMPMLAQVGQAKAGSIICNYLMQFHSVQVITFNAITDKDFIYHCPVHRLSVSKGGSFLAKIRASFRRVLEIRKLKKQINPDISIGFGNGGILWNTLSGIGEKKIASLRASLDERNESIVSKLYFFSLKWSLKHAWKIVPVSSAMNQQLKNLLHITNQNFAYNPIDIAAVQELAKQSTPLDNYLENNLFLSHLGRFYIAKGRHDLVKIFVLLKAKLPHLKLLLIGGFEDNDAQGKLIYDYCIQYLLDNNFIVTTEETGNIDADVIILKHQNNPFKYLAKTHLFVFPSLWEGFPNALVEAMACGLPVVSANCQTGPEEILFDKNTTEYFGKLLPSFDTTFDPNNRSLNENHHRWAATILEILNSSEQMNHFKRQSLQRVEAFSIEKSCEKWKNMIENN